MSDTDPGSLVSSLGYALSGRFHMKTPTPTTTVHNDERTLFSAFSVLSFVYSVGTLMVVIIVVVGRCPHFGGGDVQVGIKRKASRTVSYPHPHLILFSSFSSSSSFFHQPLIRTHHKTTATLLTTFYPHKYNSNTQEDGYSIASHVCRACDIDRNPSGST